MHNTSKKGKRHKVMHAINVSKDGSLGKTKTMSKCSVFLCIFVSFFMGYVSYE